MELSKEVNNIIVESYEFAKSNKDEFVTAEHLLYAITFEERFIEAVDELNSDALALRENLVNYISEYVEESKGYKIQES